MTFGGIAGGSWLWGVAADTLRRRPMRSSAPVVLMLRGVVHRLALRRCRQFKSLNLDPLNRFNEPLLELDLKPRSGPIVVMIDYEIADEDMPEFLTTDGGAAAHPHPRRRAATGR